MKLNKTQKYLVFSSGLWALYDGLTSGFLSPFLIFLGASNVILGILASLPYFAIMVSQIPGTKILEFVSRKYMYVMIGFASRCTWILILALPLFMRYVHVQTIIVLILLFYLLMKILELMIDPAFKSIVADVISTQKRGEFFAKRAVMEGTAAMIAFLFGGFYLKIAGAGVSGFTTLFALGAVVGLFSIYVFNKIKEPVYKDHDHHTLREFFTIKGEFRKFLTFVLYFYFGFMFASPFFTVYMLKNLGISYAYFGFLTALSTFITVATQNRFGKLTDRFGDKNIAMLSVFGTSLVPLVYFFITKDNLWMLIPAQIISGFVWGGAALAIFNLLVDFTTREKRAFQIAEFNFISSFSLMMAPILGGLVADKVTFYISGIPLVFLIGFVLRASSVVLLNRIKEPRVKTKYRLGEVFREVVSLHVPEGFWKMAKGIVRKIKA